MNTSHPEHVVTTAVATIAAVTIDCTDALATGTFWSQLTGLAIDHAGSEFTSLSGGPVNVCFVAVPEEKRVKNRVHLDLRVESLPDAEDRAVALDARIIERFDGWTVLVDPFGNEFCLVG
ncbi:MAG: VOC family protein [Actinobacteria bacterium]|nr:VOC family protein [Actinomycetota bacterium]